MPLLHGRLVSCGAARRALPRCISSSSSTNITRRPAFGPNKLHDALTLSRRWYAVDLLSLDEKWRKQWKESEDAGDTAGSNNPSGNSHFVLPMFPYPSGKLHLGHLRVYSIADVTARFRRLKGDKVMLTMGWDAFGLPAENAALERGINPETWTRSNIAKMKEQLGFMNGSWDWDRELTTCDAEFYKHTQKLFLMLHERGLAYQAEAEVNYDPVDKTVLANEQVDSNGCSWRSGAKVEKRKLKQWFFKISEFREALLQDLEVLAKDNAWPERVLAQQRNWLGKSTGALVKFPVLAMGHDIKAAIEVYTTRPDTLYGAQYVALASTHPIVAELAKKDPELQAFIDTIPGLPADSKVGYLLPHVRAINPLAYHEDTPEATKVSIPVYVAPYVLGDYGEGAVMGVPGHDIRDHAFWKHHHFDQPIRTVLAASEDESTTAMLNEPFVDHGIMTEHSGPFKGKQSAAAGLEVVKLLEGAGLAQPMEKWRLRDWLISRQRYWGTPIPIVHCDSCGAVPVPDDQLPVKLPEVDGHWAEGKTGNPLEKTPDFVNTTCPKCDGPARRDTDTMDTFVDSSWYFARYVDPHNEQQMFSPEAAKNLPVDTYIGGIEHAILHLLYARFVYKFLSTTSLLPQYDASDSVAEPFTRLVSQGMVHGRTYIDPSSSRFLKPDEVDLTDPAKPKVVATGELATISFEKMSKSKHNGVDPLECISKHGADATRAHMLFQAPVGDVLNWDEAKITGITRWLQRLHDYIVALPPAPEAAPEPKDYLAAKFENLSKASPAELQQWDADVAVWRDVQRSISLVSAAYEDIYALNTVISHLMILTNTLLAHPTAAPPIKHAAARTLITMIAPVTPAFAEECWSVLHPSAPSLFASEAFPAVDGSASAPMLQPRRQPCAVQVNGRVRGVVDIPPPPKELQGEALREWMVREILATEEGQARFGEGAYDLRSAKRAVAVRGGKTINFVL